MLIHAEKDESWDEWIDPEYAKPGDLYKSWDGNEYLCVAGRTASEKLFILLQHSPYHPAALDCGSTVSPEWITGRKVRRLPKGRVFRIEQE